MKRWLSRDVEIPDSWIRWTLAAFGTFAWFGVGLTLDSIRTSFDIAVLMGVATSSWDAAVRSPIVFVLCVLFVSLGLCLPAFWAGRPLGGSRLRRAQVGCLLAASVLGCAGLVDAARLEVRSVADVLDSDQVFLMALSVFIPIAFLWRHRRASLAPQR